MEATGRQGRRGKQLVYDLRGKRGYWKLKAEALRPHVVETRFGRRYGPVIKQLQNERICKGPGFKFWDKTRITEVCGAQEINVALYILITNFCALIIIYS